MKMKLSAHCALGLGVLFFLTGCYTTSVDFIGPGPGPPGYDDHDHGHDDHDSDGHQAPHDPGPPGSGYGHGPNADDGPPEGYAPED